MKAGSKDNSSPIFFFKMIEIKDKDDSLLVAGALLAVTRNLYVESIGIKDTAKMFEAVADSFMMTEEFIQQFKPTIH